MSIICMGFGASRVRFPKKNLVSHGLRLSGKLC